MIRPQGVYSLHCPNRQKMQLHPVHCCKLPHFPQPNENQQLTIISALAIFKKRRQNVMLCTLFVNFPVFPKLRKSLICNEFRCNFDQSKLTLVKDESIVVIIAVVEVIELKRTRPGAPRELEMESWRVKSEKKPERYCTRESTAACESASRKPP